MRDVWLCHDEAKRVGGQSSDVADWLLIASSALALSANGYRAEARCSFHRPSFLNDQWGSPLPATVGHRGTQLQLFHRPRQQRASAKLRLL